MKAIGWNVEKGNQPELPPYHTEETAKIAQQRETEKGEPKAEEKPGEKPAE